MHLDLGIEHLRRERRRLRVLSLLARVLGFGQLGAFVYFVFIRERLEPAFVALSLSGSLTNLSVVVWHKIRALPEVVLALLDPRSEVRAAAAATIEAHRREVLGETELPATIHEPDLVDMSIDDVAARVARSGPHRDWRRIGRWWLVAWAVLCGAIVVGMIALV